MQERNVDLSHWRHSPVYVCVEINVLHLFIFTYVIYFTITYFNNLFWLTKSAVVMIDLDNRLLWSCIVFSGGEH